MSYRFAFGVTVVVTAVLAIAVGAPHARQTRELFPDTKDLGRAAVEYEDDAMHVVAAYYYSQLNHDSRWILLEVAVSSDEPLRIDREDIHLLTPDGQEVPLATHRVWSQDHQRVRPLLQNAAPVRHAIGSYFKESASRNLRFFVPPFGGVAREFFNTDQWRIARGDLFFASPTGTWEEGTYSLVFEVAEEGARAVLPIDLQ